MTIWLDHEAATTRTSSLKVSGEAHKHEQNTVFLELYSRSRCKRASAGAVISSETCTWCAGVQRQRVEGADGPTEAAAADGVTEATEADGATEAQGV